MEATFDDGDGSQQCKDGLLIFPGDGEFRGLRPDRKAGGVTGDDGQVVLEVIFAAYESARTGRVPHASATSLIRLNA